MGLWLLQESRRAWTRQALQGEWGYEELIARAARIQSPGVVIDVDDPALLHPDDMPAAILVRLNDDERTRVADPVSLTRAILDSLALAYSVTIDQIELLTGNVVDAIHIVGGGSQNDLLCQLTANVTGRPVVAGPVEATALGNVLIQAMGSGEIDDLAQVRVVARASAQVRHYTPGQIDGLAERRARLLAKRATRIGIDGET
jgi:rhamnulokinase